jgi:hypothetical protein
MHNDNSGGFPQSLSPITYHEPGELRYPYAHFKPEDKNVVTYAATVLLIWKTHVNVQYIITAGLTKYVMKYITKAEPKSVVSIEHGEEKVKDHIEARRLGAMEIMCLLNSKSILKMSSGVQFLLNSMPEHRTLTVRRLHEIEINPENPYYPDSIEKYFSRSLEPLFNDLVYPQYFSMFVVQRSKRKLNNEGEVEDGVCWCDMLGNYV